MTYCTYQGKKIYYDVQGVGEPLVLLNGIMMSTLSWEVFIPSFSKSNQVIRLDFLDQGKSDHMEGEFSQSIQVEVVKAVLDDLKLTKVNLMGISYGAEVALQFAVKYQNYLKRLLIFNGTAYTNPWLADIGKAWNLAAETHNGESYYYTAIPVIYSPEFYERRLEWMRNREKILFPVFSTPAFTEAMIRLTNSSNDYDVRASLGTIHVPTLVVGSELDYIVPIAQQEYLYEHLPNASFVKIPHTGHASMYERPMLFASLVLGFTNVADDTFKV